MNSTLHAVASGPGRPGPSRSEEIIAGGEGELFIRSWRPAGIPRAVLAIVPGFNSHSGHYLWAAEQFTAMGLAVYAVDLRGRGKSSGPRFHVRHFDDYLADVDSLLRLARARVPGLPVFLLGHSAGGVIATGYALEHQNELAGLICESFAFRVPAPSAVLTLVRWFSGPFPTLPVLIVHGDADKVTVPAGSQVFFDNAGSQDKTLKLYKDHAHDLLNDAGREEVVADFKQWIERHLPPEQAAGVA